MTIRPNEAKFAVICKPHYNIGRSVAGKLYSLVQSVQSVGNCMVNNSHSIEIEKYPGKENPRLSPVWRPRLNDTREEAYNTGKGDL